MFKKLIALFLLAILVRYSYSESSISSPSPEYNGMSGTKTSSKLFETNLSLKTKDTKTRFYLSDISFAQRESKQMSHCILFNDKLKLKSKTNQGILGKSIFNKNAAKDPKRIFELYFYNYYDSYQENYIANLVSHLSFRLSNSFYAGLYLDAYADSRSTSQLIYNDRFVEVGGFFRYYILQFFYFEFRLGFAHQIDLKKNTINAKPMLVFFYRFGEPVYYAKTKADRKIKPYLDIYYAAMYDLKYKNAFIQATFTEAFRIPTGGYGYVEPYLVQYLQFDSRKLDYNNYVEVGTGLRFKVNVKDFPIIFVEPTYKSYFFGSRKNTFQIKAGFYFILNLPI